MSKDNIYSLEVDICGQKLNLTSDVSVEHIKLVSDYVNKNLRQIKLTNKSSTNTSKGIMLGLTIADDFFLFKNESAKQIQLLEEKIKTNELIFEKRLSDKNEEIKKIDAIWERELKDKEEILIKNESNFKQHLSDKEKEFVKYIDNISEIENENEKNIETIKNLNLDIENFKIRVHQLEEEVQLLKSLNELLKNENKSLKNKSTYDSEVHAPAYESNKHTLRAKKGKNR